jgi:hypothetical protein
MRKPCGNEQEVAGLRSCVKLASVAPANVASPAQDIRDRVLLSVMVYSRTCSRLDQEEPSPYWRSDASPWIDCRSALRSRCLRRGGVELFGTDDTNS